MVSPPRPKSEQRQRSESYDIFISYASEDGETAKALYDALRPYRLRVFYDQASRAELEASNLFESLRDVAQHCTICLAVVTEKYLLKPYTNFELGLLRERAANGERCLIPVYVDGAVVPGLEQHLGYRLSDVKHEAIAAAVARKVLAARSANGHWTRRAREVPSRIMSFLPQTTRGELASMFGARLYDAQPQTVPFVGITAHRLVTDLQFLTYLEMYLEHVERARFDFFILNPTWSSLVQFANRNREAPKELREKLGITREILNQIVRRHSPKLSVRLFRYSRTPVMNIVQLGPEVIFRRYDVGIEQDRFDAFWISRREAPEGGLAPVLRTWMDGLHADARKKVEVLSGR